MSEEQTSSEDFVSFLMEPEKGTPEEAKDDDKAPEAETEADDVEATLEGDAEAEDVDVEEEDLEEEDQDEPDLVPVFVDGEWKEIDREEAKRGFLRESDYTKKTMELSEQRKAFEVQLSEVDQMKADLKEQLIATAIKEPEEPDWVQLAQSLQPHEYNAYRAQFDAQKMQAEQAKTLYQEIIAEEQLEAKKKLLDLFPTWADPEARSRELPAFYKAADAAGFTEEEVNSIVDPRMFKVLEKAVLYDKMQAEQAKTVQKVAKTPKALSPGSKAQKQDGSKLRAANARKRLNEKQGADGSFVDWITSA